MQQTIFQLEEGPVMDWSVDDSLYSRFKTLKLKCENIQGAELTDTLQMHRREMFKDWCLDPNEICTEIL